MWMGRPSPETQNCFTYKRMPGYAKFIRVVNNIQEPQKNRATQKDSRQDDGFLKKGPPSGKVLNKRSYKECFVSPSGRFFAWMKRSSDKVMRNFCSEWPQTKVLRKVQPKQISRTTSTGSIGSVARDSPPRGVRCPVLSEVSLSGNLPDFVGLFCKTEKTALNENVKCIGKTGRRSLSRDKLQKEDKNEAVRRREPRWSSRKKSSELSLSSSFSEIMDTLDFDTTSLEGSRWQTSSQFHAQVFSCFTQPDYMLDTSHRRTEWVRETDKQRRKREKKERKAAKRLQKKTAKMQKSCEKRRRKMAKKEEKYASRCIIENCDFGRDRWVRPPPIQQQEAMIEDRRQMLGEPFRPTVYKKQERQEYPGPKQPYVSPRHSPYKYCEDTKARQESEEDSCDTGTSSASSRSAGKCQPEKTRSVLSTEKPSFERNMLKDFFKSFGWLYPKLSEYCGEHPERKKVDLDEREAREIRRRRKDREDCNEDRFLKVDELDQGSRISLGSARKGGQRHSPHHQHDPDHVENCDCVRLYLQAQVEKKLAALRNCQLSSTESVTTDTSKSDSDCQKPKGRKGRKKKKKEKKDRKHRKQQVAVAQPECEVEDDSRTCVPQEPAPHVKKHHTATDHPGRCEKKVRHQDEESVIVCVRCGTSPCVCVAVDKVDGGKREGSGGSTPREESTPACGPQRREVCPRKEHCRPHSRHGHDHIPIFSYLCQLWRNKSRHPHCSNRRGCQHSRSSIRRCKPVCSRCAIKQRNIDYSRPYLLEIRESSADVCHYKEECPEFKKTGGRCSPRRSPRASPRVSPRMSPRVLDHPPTHAHCFLINDNTDSCVNKTDLVCFPEETVPGRRCRPRKRLQDDESTEEEHRRRDKAIECHFVRDSQDMTDKTTETDDLKSSSSEKINRKNLKNRLVSLHCLWKNLRKCTMQKAMLGRQVGRSLKRSLSGLETYDRWWSDTWPKRRLHRRCRRRHHHKR